MDKSENLKNDSNESSIRDIAKISYHMSNALECHAEGFNSEAKKELHSLLEILPEEINVIAISKDLFASRVQKDDEIITIWRREDVHEHIKKLQTEITENPYHQHRWDWKS